MVELQFKIRKVAVIALLTSKKHDWCPKEKLRSSGAQQWWQPASSH